ncbi:hypothetical protein [Deinococcus sp. LM3]|uniref:hypothetical protein n=1 Tax=Deinococcus sp. LM3 TaxID=1938608 RepID=UPI00117F60AF|nr:hypothetical protein [Deinococcus sp. LM3]
MRIAERYGWSSSRFKNHSSYNDGVTNSVEISRNVGVFLLRQAASLSGKLSGLLFGYHEGDCLKIVMASSVGMPYWYEDGRSAELEIDPRFALGLGEAVHHIYGGEVDWFGSWFVNTEEEGLSVQKDLDVLVNGHKMAMFDNRSILLSIGWKDCEPVIRTYSYARDEGDYEIPNKILK